MNTGAIEAYAAGMAALREAMNPVFESMRGNGTPIGDEDADALADRIRDLSAALDRWDSDNTAR